ncbi:MAG: T9SS type A sorting domain-containing protein [Chitinophagaceae bacterium]|nr:T9SS type A sorting domain-containing protein [Chitinophagaceae bacterium]
MQVVTLPGTVQVQSQFVADNLGIHITATNEVTVYGMNAQQATTDAYLAFPLDAIGKEYYVLAYNKDFSFALPTQATVVATQNNTTVTITSSITDGGLTAGVPANITLQQGEVYQLRSLLDNADYTSTKITADKPISVFGGAQCTNISGSFRACDHLVEQMPPLTSWGKSFLTVPLATRLQGDVFRFLAQKNGTAVSVNGAVVANLSAGQFFETILSSTSYNRITSNEPILVGQYSRSSDADGVVSDPFFALVPPDEQFLNSYVVSAGTANIPNNHLNITSPTSNIGTVTVDGAVVSAGLWSPIPATSFSGAKVSVSSGVHTVASSLPIGLLIYGFGTYDSYGYLGGQSFSPVATVNTLVLNPKNATSPVNINRCFTATVKDQFNAAVVGVRVDFAITGPNSASTGFANTNASGVATFCYTGTADGTDNITASVGSTNDATTFIWTPLVVTCNATVTANGPTTFCQGGSVTLTASEGASYLWSTGAVTRNISVNSAGTYSVTVTDANNCTAASADVVVTVNALPAVPTITAGGATTFCSGESVTLTSSAASSYLWSNGAATQSITVTNAGTYSVTVKNAANCSASSAGVTVTVNNCGGSYCTANGTSCVKGYIRNMFACYGFNNTTGYTGYGDYTGLSVTSAPGKILGFAITPGYNSSAHPPMYVKAWIDWNGDGDFIDAGEQVFAPSIPISVKTKFWIKVPLGTSAGTKRLRVALRSDRSPLACGTFTYGEVEDYTINIAAARFAAPDATEDAFDQAGDIFIVYPNPVKDRMIIERSGYDENKAGASPAQMVVTSINGRVIMQARLNSLVQAFDVSKISTGIYFVTIISNNSKTTQKIIISH